MSTEESDVADAELSVGVGGEGQGKSKRTVVGGESEKVGGTGGDGNEPAN